MNDTRFVRRLDMLPPNLDALVAAGGVGPCSLSKVPGKNNWIEKSSRGHLPNYICHVAKAIHEERGVPISVAIAMAIGVIKDWASGRRKVKADTRSKAIAAIAEWEAMKAATHKKK